jgi:hypothetical protein
MVCRVMPAPWPSGDDSTAGADDYPGQPDGVRRPGSRPLADFLAVPVSIVIGPAMLVALCAGLPFLAWGGLLAVMFLLGIGFAIALMVRGLVELLRSR